MYNNHNTKEKRKYNMVPFGSFGRFKCIVHQIEKTSFEFPVTIGILICDGRQQCCRDYILNYVDIFHGISGPCINFYMPGYCEESDTRAMKKNRYGKFYEECYELAGNNIYFSYIYFKEFITIIEKQYNIQYQGIPELILVEVYKGRIHWERKMRFCLQSVSERNYASAYAFIRKILYYSRQCVSIDDYSNKGRNAMLKESILSVIKNNLPDYVKIISENDEIYRIK